jgi:DNA-binding NarL/FixJ family response regulator
MPEQKLPFTVITRCRCRLAPTRLDCGERPIPQKSRGSPGVEMLKILIVDDSATVRLALCSIINAQNGLRVCGEASNGAEAISEASMLRPDVVVLDLAMPVMNGINAATHINKLLPGTHLVMFTWHLTGTVEELGRSEGIEAFVAKGDSTKLLGVLQSLEAGSRNPRQCNPSHNAAR